MIDKNGIRAFSNLNYDYYELQQNFGILKKGAVFVHDPDDKKYGSIAEGCLKLCWTPKGNSYGTLCANTVFLHYSFSEDKTFLKKVDIDRNKHILNNQIEDLKAQIKQLERRIDRL